MDMMQVCPECDTAKMWNASQGPTGPDVEHEYRCENGHTFRSPVQRERKNGGNTHGLAAKLEAMDP